MRRGFSLAGGSTLAQLIPIIIAPIITRMYAPSDYGLLATFMSVVALLTAVAGGRYAAAIVLPDDDSEAANVAALSLILAGGFCATILILIPIVSEGHLDLGPVDHLGAWVYAVPAAVLLGSVYETLTYLAIRHDQFAMLGKSNVQRAAATGATQLALGLGEAGSKGLIFASFTGQVAGNYRLVTLYIRKARTQAPTRKELTRVAKTNSRFPKYDLPANLANTAAFNLVVLGLGLLYSPTVVGNYALAYRLLALPSSVIGTAIGQTYLRTAARRTNDSAAAKRAFSKTVVALASAAVIPFTLIALKGPQIFGTVFGDRWAMAGAIAVAMTPLIFVRFIASPMSTVFLVYSKQRRLLVFQLTLLLVVGVSFWAAGRHGWPPEKLILVQSTGMACVYICLLLNARRLTARAASPQL